MDYLIPTAVIVVAIALVAWWIRSSVLKEINKPREDQGITFLQNQMNAVSQQTTQQMDNLRDSLQKLNAQMQQSLNDTNKNMGERLDNAAKVISGVSRQLGELEKSSERIFDVGRSISELEAILRSPKLRGNIGELFLNDLLSQIMPPDYYKTQYGFKGGETVDAVIKLPSGMVPVDAKFPLENFKRVAEAEEEQEQAAAKRQFLRDVKKHVDAIAKKYIRTDEGTFDFALMYIPAENVYYETIIKEDEQSGEMALFAYALQKRVIPVSPNSFYAYLQTIMLGLRGLRIEENAREFMNQVSRLKKEFERFNDAFRKIGVHLDNSAKQFQDAEKRLGKIEGKMEQIEGIAGEAPAEPRVLEPPAA